MPMPCHARQLFADDDSIAARYPTTQSKNQVGSLCPTVLLEGSTEQSGNQGDGWMDGLLLATLLV